MCVRYTAEPSRAEPNRRAFGKVSRCFVCRRERLSLSVIPIKSSFQWRRPLFTRVPPPKITYSFPPSHFDAGLLKAYDFSVHSDCEGGCCRRSPPPHPTPTTVGCNGAEIGVIRATVRVITGAPVV